MWRPERMTERMSVPSWKRATRKASSRISCTIETGTGMAPKHVVYSQTSSPSTVTSQQGVAVDDDVHLRGGLPTGPPPPRPHRPSRPGRRRRVWSIVSSRPSFFAWRAAVSTNGRRTASNSAPASGASLNDPETTPSVLRRSGGSGRGAAEPGSRLRVMVGRGLHPGALVAQPGRLMFCASATSPASAAGFASAAPVIHWPARATAAVVQRVRDGGVALGPLRRVERVLGLGGRRARTGSRGRRLRSGPGGPATRCLRRPDPRPRSAARRPAW